MGLRARWVVLLLLALCCGRAEARRRVVVISIDGLRGTTLADLPQRHLKTPNLLEFVAGGAVADGLVGVFPTVTYPSHTTLVTGVSPDRHGIRSNLEFDPEHTGRDAWFWYAEQMHAPALWDVARAAGLRTGAVSWPVTVGAAIDANFPEYREWESEDDLRLYRGLCTPGLAAEFERSAGPLTLDDADELLGVNDDTRAKMAAFLIETRKPDLMLVHFLDMDHQQHAHGPDSAEAYRALEHIDGLIGQIRAAVSASFGDSDEVDFVVVSDHGFLAVDKAFQPAAVLAGLGLGAPAGHPDRWRVAVFDSGSSFGLIVHDPKDTAAVALATNAFKRIATASGIAKIYTGAELAATGGYGNTFLAATMQPGFMVGRKTAGPRVTSTGGARGMHGNAPGDARLDAAFVAFGRSVPAKRLGRKRLVDVAPTVAALLGFGMPEVEGANLLEK
ncbi:Predicted pyrophosphatase or phosphodiesterase, AlkP superfamily [Granulicella rosea]|uniref:Predicted pyrophosphatase or phosphodiesterase, AlkP superfamily n=1 Tax=Granulicella rosea TaxID=474952 RepID=A0A239CM33_9BACT|nr:ectonucleotide pyrophosphatase/phosphodiesterase [Granulicella rosea]SNS21197.1 Predicted pyrophosphatase or phosphodiesterase, AlkP superfamily [Granulicella rosea]